jgi:prepilin-type N-terminal cleavage/methylation domain-containing protein
VRINKAKNSASRINSILSSQSGFTLVELLIVIVIIGILAGVVIGVLNPIQQQNRARDGASRAQIDKMALSAKSLYVSSPRTTQRAPTLSEYIGGLSSTTNSTCASTSTSATESCTFEITGQPLAAASTSSCSATTLYNGNTGNAQCKYIYYRETDLFRIAARGQANPVQLFVYSYAEDPNTGNVTEGFWSCPATFAIATAPSSPTCTQIN